MTADGSWRSYEGDAFPPVPTAALTAFVDQGYHGTSVREIASRAGLSVPGLYHHYPSKQAMLVGITSSAMTELLDRSSRAESEAGPAPAHRFDAVVESLLLFHVHRRDVAFVCSTEIRSLHPAEREAYVGQRDAQQRMLDRIVLDGVEAGVFGTAHPLDASRAVTTMCVGVATWYRPGGRLDPAALVDVYSELARGTVQATARP
ncbi:TetR/AcrR family transcriptional regulator [Rhodococcoides corynebacterioides]|uniref:TetR/AcrR family transcriptional regulator n=1 Tax=Rhodococcoides corynebacterioides TaxID=53972 RepID=UPI003AE00CDA